LSPELQIARILHITAGQPPRCRHRQISVAAMDCAFAFKHSLRTSFRCGLRAAVYYIVKTNPTTLTLLLPYQLGAPRLTALPYAKHANDKTSSKFFPSMPRAFKLASIVHKIYRQDPRFWAYGSHSRVFTA